MADKKHIARVTEEIEFADGKTRTVRPLTIKSLREFVKIVEGLELSGDSIDDETFDRMVEASYIVLRQSDKEIDKESVEDIVDLDNFQKIMAVAMGNRLFDPNPTAVEG